MVTTFADKKFPGIQTLFQHLSFNYSICLWGFFQKVLKNFPIDLLVWTCLGEQLDPRFEIRNITFNLSTRVCKNNLRKLSLRFSSRSQRQKDENGTSTYRNAERAFVAASFFSQNATGPLVWQCESHKRDESRCFHNLQHSGQSCSRKFIVSHSRRNAESKRRTTSCRNTNGRHNSMRRDLWRSCLERLLHAIAFQHNHTMVMWMWANFFTFPKTKTTKIPHCADLDQATFPRCWNGFVLLTSTQQNKEHRLCFARQRVWNIPVVSTHALCHMQLREVFTNVSEAPGGVSAGCVAQRVGFHPSNIKNLWTVPDTKLLTTCTKNCMSCAVDVWRSLGVFVGWVPFPAPGHMPEGRVLPNETDWHQNGIVCFLLQRRKLMSCCRSLRWDQILQFSFFWGQPWAMWSFQSVCLFVHLLVQKEEGNSSFFAQGQRETLDIGRQKIFDEPFWRSWCSHPPPQAKKRQKNTTKKMHKSGRKMVMISSYYLKLESCLSPSALWTRNKVHHWGCYRSWNIARFHVVCLSGYKVHHCMGVLGSGWQHNTNTESVQGTAQRDKTDHSHWGLTIVLGHVTGPHWPASPGFSTSSVEMEKQNTHVFSMSSRTPDSIVCWTPRWISISSSSFSSSNILKNKKAMLKDHAICKIFLLQAPWFNLPSVGEVGVGGRAMEPTILEKYSVPLPPPPNIRRHRTVKTKQQTNQSMESTMSMWCGTSQASNDTW